MSIASDNGLEKQERRFYCAALRRGYVSSSIVRLLTLISMISYTISLVCTVDSGFQGQARIALFCAIAWSILTFIAILMDRRKRVRDVLLSLDRCGECAQKLTGSHTTRGRGVSARTCCECGTVWTDLDRQASIESVYRTN